MALMIREVASMNAFAKPSILLGVFRLVALFVVTILAVKALENVLSGTQINNEDSALAPLVVGSATLLSTT